MRGPMRLVAVSLLGIFLLYLIFATTRTTVARPGIPPQTWSDLAKHNPFERLRQSAQPSTLPGAASHEGASHLELDFSQLQAEQGDRLPSQAQPTNGPDNLAPSSTFERFQDLNAADAQVQTVDSSSTVLDKSTTPHDAAPTVSSSPSRPTQISRGLVMAKQFDVPAHWIQAELSSWETTIYNITNITGPIDLANPPLDLQFPSKGGASVAFLTWILANYDNLPDVTFFIAALPQPRGLHADTIMRVRDVAPTLHAVNATYVLDQNFTSMRCNANPGCATPSEEIRPLATSTGPGRAWQKEVVGLWEALHLGSTSIPVPERIANPPGVQFAVARHQVLAQTKEQYESVMRWVNNSNMDEESLMLVMESTWHLILGRQGLDCPDDRVCLCDFYNKECLEEDEEDSQASLSPTWSDLREGRRRKKKKKWSTWFGRS